MFKRVNKTYNHCVREQEVVGRWWLNVAGITFAGKKKGTYISSKMKSILTNRTVA
jgi:hypothetical protein